VNGDKIKTAAHNIALRRYKLQVVRFWHSTGGRIFFHVCGFAGCHKPQEPGDDPGRVSWLNIPIRQAARAYDGLSAARHW
jgi:hypothetical protein